ncbi:hypothetical protein ABID12_001872 [Martelella mangrovi]|uniref:Uncharacterized protein n=1 Tax=Martelella mangrovi TaxID=1397477 RepID=A0ABV2ICG5_9HYPH
MRPVSQRLRSIARAGHAERGVDARVKPEHDAGGWDGRFLKDLKSGKPRPDSGRTIPSRRQTEKGEEDGKAGGSVNPVFPALRNLHSMQYGRFVYDG